MSLSLDTHYFLRYSGYDLSVFLTRENPQSLTQCGFSVELLTRFELVTSSLPRTRSADSAIRASLYSCGFRGCYFPILLTHYVPTKSKYRFFTIVGNLVGTVTFLEIFIPEKSYAKRVCGFRVSGGAFPYQGCALPPEL